MFQRALLQTNTGSGHWEGEDSQAAAEEVTETASGCVSPTHLSASRREQNMPQVVY